MEVRRRAPRSRSFSRQRPAPRYHQGSNRFSANSIKARPNRAMVPGLGNADVRGPASAAGGPSATNSDWDRCPTHAVADRRVGDRMGPARIGTASQLAVLGGNHPCQATGGQRGQTLPWQCVAPTTEVYDRRLVVCIGTVRRAGRRAFVRSFAGRGPLLRGVPPYAGGEACRLPGRAARGMQVRSNPHRIPCQAPWRDGVSGERRRLGKLDVTTQWNDACLGQRPGA